jgi:thiamine pyrophosphate-dependent acetolactate synthase large subunit-like protein
MTASDLLIERLIDWGVSVIFGLPGDGINGIMEALRTRQDKIRFIQVRHEEAAAFMACSYAKFTGKLGVCLATSGPGGIHLLNGLYDAKLDGAPVLALTGMAFHDLTHRAWLQRRRPHHLPDGHAGVQAERREAQQAKREAPQLRHIRSVSAIAS